jgi:gas vesicle protein
MKKTTERLAVGATIAAAVGYVAGILTAPKSGKETRAEIQRNASKARTEAEHQLKGLHSELNSLINDGKDQANKANAKVKKELAEVLAKAHIAKDKAREMLSAIHEGDAEDRDLQKAISEVSKAIKHLKKYLNNPPADKAQANKTTKKPADKK